MEKLLESIKKNGLRKAILALAFLGALCAMGPIKVLTSSDWKGCFEILCLSVFASNAAEHFAKKKENDIPTAPVA